jgi:hypothetical protein
MASKNKETGMVSVDHFQALAVGGDFAEVVAANIGNATIAPFDLDRIKVPAGGGLSWEVPTLEGVTQAESIEGVIVNWRKVRSYWRESFESAGGGTPPDCSSEDGITGIGDPGGDCVRCPLSRYGSAENGRAQACSEKRMLFVIRQDDRLPIVLTIPPSSLGRISQYFLRLLSGGVPYFGAVTRFSLEKARNKGGISYSQVVPSLVAVVSPEEQHRIHTYIEGLRPLFSATSAQEVEA